MQAKIRKVKFNSEGKNPLYKVILECPKGKELYIHFDYTNATKTFWPLEVNYNGEHKGAKLAWYTREVEDMTVDAFLGGIAMRINKKYGFK
ncbi:hypothetical protein [Ornithinibacillus halotolerans]|uniref:Uncharacterized protein n=1 Tax=Ornithinibacillus halotolerans TaxID=1274357 RepID=A0A916WF33_9BACI|nr:hypothetical protein [Ornithinibacillus halotolerans]GGA91756.1 hypothetical protein GCM10008025_37810 [Ornithinibacillus halotolerans]